jgi:hypothetical protein
MLIHYVKSCLETRNLVLSGIKNFVHLLGYNSRMVRQKSTNVSEEHIFSIFNVILQKMEIFKIIVTTASNPEYSHVCISLLCSLISLLLSLARRIYGDWNSGQLYLRYVLISSEITIYFTKARISIKKYAVFHTMVF